MLLLTTPAQHSAHNPAVECDPRRIKQWLETLPTDNVQTTVSQLLTALKPFNELQLDVKVRLKLLETYHSAFDTILYAYDEMHLRSLNMAETARRQLCEDLMWVYLELANGYKSIVKAVYEGEQAAPTQPEILLAIYRGIELIANALIHAFRNHRVPPPLAYLEIHQLYLLAEQSQLATKPITFLANKSHTPQIQHLYKRIMLLIAADAYAFDGHQISELYELLDPYTETCQLTTTLSGSADIPGFFIDLTEDNGPCCCGKMRIDVLLDTQRILQVEAVVQRITADINKERHLTLNSMRAGELRLLRLFVRNLQYVSRAREQRQLLNSSVRVAYALEASAYYLQHRDRFLDESTESVTGIEVRDIEFFEAEHELSTWTTVNASSQGIMLSCNHEQGGHFAVGEVVAIVESLNATREPLVNTGLIRWIRYVEDHIQMGVEYLPGLPMAVSCVALGDEHGEEAPFTALYFPSNKTSKQAACLLFEFEQFRYASKFRVDVAGRQYCIEPVKLFRESPVHVQFGFRIINA